MQFATINLILSTFVISCLLLSSFTILIFLLNKIYWIDNSHSEKLIQISNNHQNEIIRVKADAEEAVLSHIGRELHDNICQSLVLANLHLQVVLKDYSEESKNKIMQASNTIIHSLNELKLLAKEINSDVAMQLGLIQSIKDLIIRIEDTNVLKIGFQVVGEPVYLSRDLELGVFRILQESLTNTVKHALASRANIELNFSKNLISVVYQDNGKGYDGANPIQNVLSGMINIKNRVAMLKANLKTNTIINNGSSIFLTVPINQ